MSARLTAQERAHIRLVLRLFTAAAIVRDGRDAPRPAPVEALRLGRFLSDTDLIAAAAWHGLTLAELRRCAARAAARDGWQERVAA